MFSAVQLAPQQEFVPYSREALRACGVDPEATNPVTGAPNYLYPGELPPDVLARCQSMWNIEQFLPYGVTGPQFYVFGGEIGKPDSPAVKYLLDAQKAAGDKPVTWASVATVDQPDQLQLEQMPVPAAGLSGLLFLVGGVVLLYVLLRR